MNTQTYRLVFNPARACLVAVAETARGCGQGRATGCTRERRRWCSSAGRCESNRPIAPVEYSLVAINSGVFADKGISVTAGGNINILAAANTTTTTTTTSQQAESSSTSIGLIGGLFTGDTLRMHAVPEQFEFPSDRAEFRAVAARAGVELYRAHIVRHAFEPHTHDAYGFGVIEQGVERFRYKGSDHLAPPDSIVLMHPDVLHTGRAETAGGWRYRMIYIEPTALAEISGDAGWWFDEAVVERDRPRAQSLARLLEALWQAPDPLAFDSLLVQLVDGVRPLARQQAGVPQLPVRRFSEVLDYMQAHLDERIVLDDLAAVADLSPFHFLRQFQVQYHVTPHQMLMSRRLYAAKQWLAQGLAPAQVAAMAGLTDQAHLTRAFGRRYGVSPARYQRQVA